MKANKKNLIKMLETIGFSIKDTGAGFNYIFDNNGEILPIYLYGEVEQKLCQENDHKMSIIFYLEDCFIRKLKDSKSIAVYPKSNKDVFILFMNHNK